jgi:hypothetical protein
MNIIKNIKAFLLAAVVLAGIGSYASAATALPEASQAPVTQYAAVSDDTASASSADASESSQLA